MTYENLGLKENPFRLTPPLDKKDLVWAGMNTVKQGLETRIKLSMKTLPSRIVLNWGAYGSGKTHAALYYSKTDALHHLATEQDAKPAVSIKITLPRSSGNIVQEFLRSFLGQYSLEKIHTDFQKLKEKFGSEQLDKMIDTFSSDSIIADIYKSLIDSAEGKEDYFNILKNYIHGDSTKATLSYLELPYGLTNDEQIANFLATFINCVTYEKQYYSAFIIWLDEFEDIDTIKKGLADRFTTFIRQFIDKTPSNLILFINFTQKAFMNIEDLSLYMGEALTSRAKAKIDFANPTLEEAVKYVEELCNLFVVEGSPCPLKQEIIRYVLEHIGNLTARKINETFSIILEMSLILNQNHLDTNFIDSITDEIIAWEA